jgi:hypothetical protein
MTMMPGESYPTKVQKIFQQRGWRSDVSANDLLKKWELFVEICRRGYGDNIYEYQNDLSVRTMIEAILAAPEMQEYPELREYRQNVEKVDKLFRNLLHPTYNFPNREYWWERGVVKYADQDLVNDLREQYGFEIAQVA